ncbi:hypothetical protein M514_06500 [Trichuris suis]|uniref:WAP domain-containing protein n=1 Tax=Trichuris suis TaxID=68888 RepID=A0A085M607_9BILA|nr:hypothetical protein M513_06500 [Trichuris suis]KFD63840.1 hypothetical protein M514_06500 [Trichuris suis]
MNAIHVYLSFTLLWCVTFAHNSYHKRKRHSQEKWKNKLEEEHPGSCPDMQLEKPLTSNNDKCTSDKQCKITQKCCPTAIGKMCMETKDASNEQKPNEIKHTKPGECPALTKVEPKRRSEYRVKSCTHDKDCPGHKLCCQTNIGPLCMLPAKSNPDSKTCGDGSEPLGTCNDFRCPYGYQCQSGICCRILKSGKCPERKTKMLRMIQLSTLGEPCDCDCDCIRDYKCCIEDGDSKCVKPEYDGRYKYFPRYYWTPYFW